MSTDCENALDVLNTFQSVVAALGQEFQRDLVAVALFGSTARREAGPRSDLDFLVVLSHVPRGIERRSHVYQSIHKAVAVDGVSRDVTVLDVDERYIVNEEAVVTPLILNVAADAVILYDPKGELLSFVNRVKRIVEVAGLERYSVGGGKYGWKPRDGLLREVEA